MLQAKYLDLIKQKTRSYFPKEEVKICIFGSALRREKFRDVDIGFLGDIDKKKLSSLDEELTESTLPFFIDLVNFNNVSEDFKNFVLNQEKILWI